MHSKTLLTTLLASQLAIAAVIPLTERDAGINPISGLPDPGSRLNPISGLPVPPHRKPKHKHKHHKHKIIGPGGINPISGLPAPRVKVHGRDAEPEAVADPVRTVTNVHTSTKTVWFTGTPQPHPKNGGQHPKHPNQGHGNGQSWRAKHGNINPVNGLPAPSDPAYGKHPHAGNGARPHSSNAQQPQNNGGGQPKHPKNGNGAHPKDGNNGRPHPTHTQPKGIVITPLISVTVHGRPTMVPAPKPKHAPHPNPAPDHRASHGPLHTQTPLSPPSLATPHPLHQHKGPKDMGDGMIGLKPSRRDVDDLAPAPTGVAPEAYGEYAEKAEQLSAYDEGIAETEDGEEDDDEVYSFPLFGDEEDDKDEADDVVERDVDENGEAIDDEIEENDEDEDEDEETDETFERDAEDEDADGEVADQELDDEAFQKKYAADRQYWDDLYAAQVLDE